MVDVSAFFDDSGGKYYGQTINSGMAGLLLAVGLDGLPFTPWHGAGSVIIDPLIKRNEAAGRQALGYRASLAGRTRLNQSLDPANRGWRGRAGVLRNMAKQDAQRAITRMRPHIEGVVSRQNAGLLRTKSSLKMVSRAMMASFLFEVGEAIFTPGISKLASAKEAEVFGNTRPMDSPTAYTMRSRALEAIYSSQSSLRNVLGNESSYLHS